MIVYLVHTEVDEGFTKEEKVQLFETEQRILAMLGYALTGNGATEVKKIYKVDMVYGTTKQLKPVLEDFKIKLQDLI